MHKSGSGRPILYIKSIFIRNEAGTSDGGKWCKWNWREVEVWRKERSSASPSQGLACTFWDSEKIILTMKVRDAPLNRLCSIFFNCCFLCQNLSTSTPKQGTFHFYLKVKERGDSGFLVLKNNRKVLWWAAIKKFPYYVYFDNFWLWTRKWFNKRHTRYEIRTRAFGFWGCWMKRV